MVRETYGKTNFFSKSSFMILEGRKKQQMIENIQSILSQVEAFVCQNKQPLSQVSELVEVQSK
jgi:hypothetical protein